MEQGGLVWCQGQAAFVDGAPPHRYSWFFIFITMPGSQKARSQSTERAAQCQACSQPSGNVGIFLVGFLQDSEGGGPQEGT